MFRCVVAAALWLGLVVLIAYWLSDRGDPDAQARRAFLRKLAASPSWTSVELECTSPGCANHVKACWSEADVRYLFSGFRQPKSMGRGVVMVYAANSYRDGAGPALVTYCFMSDGSPTKVEVGEVAALKWGWVDLRAREFFDATPAND